MAMINAKKTQKSDRFRRTYVGFRLIREVRERERET